MNFPVFSQLAGNFSSLLTVSSSGESVANRFLPRICGAINCISLRAVPAGREQQVA
jgi:hypothetical protein